MKTFQTVILVAMVGLSLAHERNKRALPNLIEMINLLKPDSSSVNDYLCPNGDTTKCDPLDDCYPKRLKCLLDVDLACSKHYSKIKYSYDDETQEISCDRGNDCMRDYCKCEKEAAECFMPSV